MNKSNYRIYLDTILLPVTPERISIKVGDKNNSVELANGSEHTFIKQASLREISFQCLLPNQKYGFAQYYYNYEPAKVFVEKLIKLKNEQKAFQFIFNRVFDDKNKKKINRSENIKVVIRDLEFTEEHGNGNDIMVSINLKEVDDSKTKVEGKNGVKTRETSKAPTANTTYTVKKGDCLWDIAKKFYGDGSKYKKIADANKSKITNPNKIQVGMVLTIPKQ